MKNRVYCQIWGAAVPTIEGVPVADYNFMYHPYCVHGSKCYLVHMAYIPALLWNQNRVYGLVWDAVVPTNKVVPMADYDFMAVWNLYCMYQPYWDCGSKGYLVHATHIPSAMEWKVAYMAKFGVPSFLTIVGVPMADYDFKAVWPPNCMYQPYWVRGSKGYLVHIAHIPALMWNQNRVNGLVWDSVLPTNEGVPVADYDLMAIWILYCVYQPYWVCGSKGYLVHKAHISPAVELK